MGKTTETSRHARAWSAVRFIIAVLLFAMALSAFAVVFRAKQENKAPMFFGYSFSIVVTGSMEPDIKVGDFLVVRKAEIENVQVGDDILFVALSGSVRGQHIVHRVVETGTDEDGVYCRTQGTNNPIADADRVYAGNFVGKAVAHSTFFGKVFTFLTNIKTLMMVGILLFVVPFAIGQIVKIVRLAKEDEPSAEQANDPEKRSDAPAKHD